MFVKMGFNPQTPQGGLSNCLDIYAPLSDLVVNPFIFSPYSAADHENYYKGYKCNIEFLRQ
jgi:hypothetical protein